MGFEPWGAGVERWMAKTIPMSHREYLNEGFSVSNYVHLEYLIGRFVLAKYQPESLAETKMNLVSMLILIELYKS